MKRAVGQTFTVSADAGRPVVQISRYQLTFENETAVITNQAVRY